MRCLFTMFAEDVGLLPNRSFTQLLADLRHDVPSFQPMIEHLWRTMDDGRLLGDPAHADSRASTAASLPTRALPLDAGQLQLLSEAARADWRDVEPAIFGTLLERALDPVERHKLGAHYTPRAYVERLVQPTVIEPLRQEWESVQDRRAALAGARHSWQGRRRGRGLSARLAQVRVLDPACGTGNFLYVTLEHLKRLEGEVLQVRTSWAQAR
jgi:hypothetical protein